MKIEVLGTGCPSCHKLHEQVLQVVSDNNLALEVSYISGEEAMEKIIELGALSAPVLTFDDRIVLTGGNFSPEKIKDLIIKHNQ